MKYIVDTHILLWHSEGQDKLSREVLNVLDNNPSDVFVSHATFWEITIKKSLDKLDLVSSVHDFYQAVLQNSFLPLHFDISSYSVLETLPFHHQDPFDRMIIAQAISNNFMIITQDHKFRLYEKSVQIMWN